MINEVLDRYGIVKRVYYDPETDIPYILLRKDPVEDTVEALEDAFIEQDGKREAIGIGIRHALKMY